MIDDKTTSYRQSRCRHGWVDKSQCETCRDLAAAADQIARMRGLLDRVMVSANHLATHVDLDGPTWRGSYDEGLAYYGTTPAYDAWCCWKGIMLVREDMKRD